MNVGQNTTLGDCDTSEQLVQFLIVADGKLKVTGDDTGLLVVTGSVTSKLKNFSSEVLENSSEVNGSTGTNALGVVALAKKTVNTTNGEGKTSLRRTTSKTISMCKGKREELKRTTERSWHQRPCHQTFRQSF